MRTTTDVTARKMTAGLPGRMSLTLLLCLAGATAWGETPLRNAFDSQEMKLVAETNLAYAGCMQNAARAQLESSPDIRVVAGNAAETCGAILLKLQDTLDENGVNPDFYMGATQGIKNRAIRRLLPLLMMEKSNRLP